MLERLRLSGYRLLDDFEADLGQLTVVIGANATGKSTILDALSLITYSLEFPVEDVLSVRGGLLSILNRSGTRRDLRCALTLAKPKSHPLWHVMPIDDDRRLVFEARLGHDATGKTQVLVESLRDSEPYDRRTQPLKLLEVRGSSAKIYDAQHKKLRAFNEPKPPQSSDSKHPDAPISSLLPTPRAALLLSQMRFINEYPIQTWMRGYMASFAYYPGFDVSREAPVRTKLAEIKPITTLNPNGDNLGAVLHEVLTRHDFRNVATDLSDFFVAAYPQVEAISAETAFGGEPRVLVRVRERGLHRATEVWELSDGMLRFLLIATALLNPIPPGFVAIDEPEAGLHPKLLPVVADMIRAASERSQILVTTHSPELLSRFDLTDIAVLRRDENSARWHRPADRASLRTMLEAELGGTLGELHTSGELEAIA